MTQETRRFARNVLMGWDVLSLSLSVNIWHALPALVQRMTMSARLPGAMYTVSSARGALATLYRRKLKLKAKLRQN